MPAHKSRRGSSQVQKRGSRAPKGNALVLSKEARIATTPAAFWTAHLRWKALSTSRRALDEVDQSAGYMWRLRVNEAVGNIFSHSASLTVDKLLREAKYLCGLSPQEHPLVLAAVMERVSTLHFKRPIHVVNTYTAWGEAEAAAALVGADKVAAFTGLCMSEEVAAAVRAMLEACESSDRVRTAPNNTASLKVGEDLRVPAVPVMPVMPAVPDLMLVCTAEIEVCPHGAYVDLVAAVGPPMVAIVGAPADDGVPDLPGYRLKEALPMKTGGYSSAFKAVFIFEKAAAAAASGAGAGNSSGLSAW